MTLETLTYDESISVPKEGSYLRRVILSCMIGNALEWYDFALYGYFATIIGQLFFPKFSTVSSLMATFGVFAAGFIMRPLGGIIFGHIGDKIGRKSALLWSIYLMAIPTTLIGLLPTYDQIGWLAPLLLTIIRLVQGLSMGGEFTGSMIFVVENAQQGNRGLYGSWVVFSLLVGILLGSAIASSTCYFLSEDQLTGWGWRIPFLVSVIGGVWDLLCAVRSMNLNNLSKQKNITKNIQRPLLNYSSITQKQLLMWSQLSLPSLSAFI